MNSTFQQVLIVDDCSLTLRRLAKELRDAGYLVVTANSAIDALKILKESCPDYVITDWQMPNMNGQMLCQCIRAMGLEKYVYVILMTAHSDLLDVVSGLGAGADDYITKPVNIRELVARLKSGNRILKLDQRLSYDAEHDPLTGIFNRRNMIPQVRRIIDMCSSKKVPVSAIMVDLDRFKQINDEHGHFVGDYVLVQVANVLANRFRNDDYVCRYGGEEFVVILPDCDLEGAANCAERCRFEIEQLTFEQGSVPINVTASFGVAQFQETCSATKMLDHADEAMRHAKRDGRNRVVKYSADGNSSHMPSLTIGMAAEVSTPTQAQQ